MAETGLVHDVPEGNGGSTMSIPPPRVRRASRIHGDLVRSPETLSNGSHNAAVADSHPDASFQDATKRVADDTLCPELDQRLGRFARRNRNRAGWEDPSRNLRLSPLREQPSTRLDRAGRGHTYGTLPSAARALRARPGS